jgi:hypothetical protein
VLDVMTSYCRCSLSSDTRGVVSWPSCGGWEYLGIYSSAVGMAWFGAHNNKEDEKKLSVASDMNAPIAKHQFVVMASALVVGSVETAQVYSRRSGLACVAVAVYRRPICGLRKTACNYNSNAADVKKLRSLIPLDHDL